MIHDLNAQMAKGLVNLFYPLVELTLFDENGNVSESLNAFSNLKEDLNINLQDLQSGSPYPELLANGKTVRSLIYPLAHGYLRLRYDQTYFKNLQEQLSFLLHTSESSPKENTNNWKDSIDQLIAEYHHEHKINGQASTAKQKRELISLLQHRGLLDFKESSAYVASKLQISRATVYNYLKTSASFKKVRIHQVDAFTCEQFGGNPAGVVLDADDLDESTMRKITRELNLSETAFVLSSKKGDLRMRYFTPTGHEITFCGHSTVGSLYMIAKEKRFGINNAGSYQFDVETPCGILKMETFIDDIGDIRVAYETPKIKLSKTEITHTEVAEAAGFDLRAIDLTYPVMYEETNRDLYVVIKTLEALKKIECDPKTFAQFSKQHNIVALCLFTPEAFDTQHHFHMRCFAPLVGIPEDPFTGSVLGGLTAYVDTFGLLPKGSHTFQVEQGHILERPGVVSVEFAKHLGKYQAKVFAQAVHCFSTEINLT